MTPLGNINLNKILEKIARMFMKRSYGHAFQLVKGCYALTNIRRYKLNGEASNIVAQGKEKKHMCQGSCLMGFLLDHKNLKIGAPNVENNFTCHWLVELW
jgi:hypothetical protein